MELHRLMAAPLHICSDANTEAATSATARRVGGPPGTSSACASADPARAPLSAIQAESQMPSTSTISWATDCRNTNTGIAARIEVKPSDS